MRPALSEPEERAACHVLARQIVGQVRECQRHGLAVFGVVGSDSSPACGVRVTHYHGRESGLRAAREELEAAGIRLPLPAVADRHWAERAVAICEVLAAG
ncbi:MAG: hypothetical protein AB1505_23775 [Candidatus Latescibacterota bacterium]